MVGRPDGHGLAEHWLPRGSDPRALPGLAGHLLRAARWRWREATHLGQGELDELQGYNSRPLDVMVENGRRAEDHPKLAGVVVMHNRKQCDQNADVHLRL